MRFRLGIALVLTSLTISLPACDSSESEVLYAQCETYVSVYLGWCARCTNFDPARCEELLIGSSSLESSYCFGRRPQEADSEDSNFFRDCLQPLDSLACESSLPTACLLRYDEDLAEEQMND
jgi:hypothetical protein